jgi:hypothetical protein
MNRMNIIQFINPTWHKQLIDFLEEHPAFERLLPIVALDEYPCGFNKNPHESEPNAPLNIFETILWGISHAGVDIKYGDQQYLQMLKYMREVPYFTENMEFPFEVQEKKIKTYRSLINMCLERDISPPELTLEDMSFVEYVEDIADSTIVYVYMLYGPVGDPNVIPHADEYFNKGIEMFYGIPNPTRQQIKAITDTWSNKKVGLMFITQYAHYSSYIKEDGRIEPPIRKVTNEEVDSKFEDKKNEIAATITNIIHEIAYEEMSKRQKPQYSTIPINISGPNPMTVFMTVSEEPVPPPTTSIPISEPITISTSGMNASEILSNINNIINSVTNNTSSFNSTNLNTSSNNNTITTTSKKKESKVKEPKVKEPKVKEPKVKEPKVKEPKVKEPKVKEPKVKEIKPRAPRKKKINANEEEVEQSIST